MPTRKLMMLAGLALAIAVLASAPALASIELVTKWGSEGPGDGQFGSLTSIATDSEDNVYVLDAVKHRIQKFDSSGTFITKWGSEGSGDGQFTNPRGIATDSEDNVYVADYYVVAGYSIIGRIEKFDSAGNFLTKWLLSGGEEGAIPFAVGTDSSDSVYAAAFDNPYAGAEYFPIQKFDSNGTPLAEWGSFGPGEGQLSEPWDLTTDSSDNVYVADSRRIVKFNSAGNFLSEWRAGGSASGVATDSEDDVYVADVGNDRIEKFDPSGTFLGRWGSQGSGDGQFDSPSDVATDSEDNVYVADSGNHRMAVFHIGPIPPDTAIASGPSGTTHDPTPQFAFSSSSPEPYTDFQCKVDGGPYELCASPWRVPRALGEGPHTFSVRATDPGATDPTPATRSFTVRTAFVRVEGRTLVVTAAKGVKDHVTIRSGGNVRLRVVDHALHVGTGCTRTNESGGGRVAYCGGAIAHIQVQAGDGDDKVANRTGVSEFRDPIPSSLRGGRGRDTLIGSSDRDTLIGGPAADEMRGKDGDDLLKARDHGSDELIDCGRGADETRLDKLPKDPNFKVKRCELKRRH